ncbi:hypothetical protein C0J52_06688 [Blattella germanica]|nr:hypothetical protein C0J52_06688 [Blattella germanica]
MIVRTILVTITIAAMGRAAILPIEETDFQLSASDNDIGNWTASVGDMETEEQKTATENRIPIIKDSWTEIPRLPIKRKVPVDYLPIDFLTEIPDNDLLDTTDSDGFEMFDGVGWFKLDSRRLKFDEARLACEASSAHLAVPDTPEKLHVLGKLFERHSKVEYFEYEQVYVGLSDLDQDRIFTTVDGKKNN